MIIQKTINAIKTSWKGLSLTLKHFFAMGKRRKGFDIKSDNYFGQQEGLVTLQYPKEKIPVPEVGRYQLHVEIDDCIVCDLCAKICPVDCIEIESIKATGPIGQTSDGSTKRLYPAKFDIDMAKCMYCGLCTVVCPTECITMTDQFDRSFTNISELTYKFSDMSAEDAAEKREELAKQQAERQAAKEAAAKGNETKAVTAKDVIVKEAAAKDAAAKDSAIEDATAKEDAAGDAATKGAAPDGAAGKGD